MLSEIASLSARDIFLGRGSKVSISGNTRKLDPFISKTLEDCLAFQKRPAFLLEDTIDDMINEIRTTSRDNAKLISKLEHSLETARASQQQMLDLQGKLSALKERPVDYIPHLPGEIARHIFMMSAEDGQRQRRTLSLVSSQIQRWLDPFFFRHIVTPRHSPRIGTFPSRILQWATSLTVTTDIPGAKSRASSITLNPFSCLDTIKFETIAVFSSWDFSIPTLRHMFIAWRSMEAIRRSLNPLPQKLMGSLTHIHVTFLNQVCSFPWDNLANAENLVFLVIDSVETNFSRDAESLKANLNTMQSRISEFSAAPSLEAILWVNHPMRFTTAEWHSCTDVPIDHRLVLGTISASQAAECDFGKFCVLGVENEYRAFDIWSLEGQLLDRTRTALRTRSK